MAISNRDIGSAQFGTGSGISYLDIGSAQAAAGAPPAEISHPLIGTGGLIHSPLLSGSRIACIILIILMMSL